MSRVPAHIPCVACGSRDTYQSLAGEPAEQNVVGLSSRWSCGSCSAQWGPFMPPRCRAFNRPPLTGDLSRQVILESHRLKDAIRVVEWSDDASWALLSTDAYWHEYAARLAEEGHDQVAPLELPSGTDYKVFGDPVPAEISDRPGPSCRTCGSKRTWTEVPSASQFRWGCWDCKGQWSRDVPARCVVCGGSAHGPSKGSETFLCRVCHARWGPDWPANCNAWTMHPLQMNTFDDDHGFFSTASRSKKALEERGVRIIEHYSDLENDNS